MLTKIEMGGVLTLNKFSAHWILMRVFIELSCFPIHFSWYFNIDYLFQEP